jgi:hypothetical protein
VLNESKANEVPEDETKQDAAAFHGFTVLHEVLLEHCMICG